MPSIDRPQSLVTVNAVHHLAGSGSVDLQVENGTISLTPEEARALADHLRNCANEAETEPSGRQVRVRAEE